MPRQYGTVEVRKQKGAYVVLGTGTTNKGVKFIKAMEKIDAKGPRDPKFKGAVAAAVAKLFESDQ